MKSIGLKRPVLVAGLLYLLPNSGMAAEFSWFTDVQKREGWIEFAAQTTQYQNRIHIFPRLSGPDGQAFPRVASRDDGAVVTIGIENRSPADTQEFISQVLSRVVGRPGDVSSQYQLNVPRPRSVQIAVLRDGETLATRSIDGQIPGDYTAQVKVPAVGSERDAILRGDYQVEASFDLPTATFSSLSISVKESLVAHYKIEALKSVVKSARTSGGKFLFFDWRRRSARTVINQSISEQRSVQAQRYTGVMTVDPDEAMLARVEKLLGISQLSKEEFVANHLRAAEQAEQAGNYELAALHREYALKADDPTPRVQTELLEKAFAALGQSEPAIGAFLANGIQFSETSGSSSSRFHGFGRSDSSYFGENGYAEMRLTTSLVRYTVTAGPFAADDTAIRGWFGTSTPNEEAATRGLLKAIEQGNIAMVRAALTYNAAHNAVYGLDRKTPLIMAAQRCDIDIVGALLSAGANPYLRDSNGRNAKTYAARAGCNEVVELINSNG